MKKFLKKLKHGIIYLFVAPAAIIHAAYQVWYFREFYLKSGPAEPAEHVGFLCCEKTKGVKPNHIPEN